MPYAQIRYQEKVGNSNLTIAEVGCFVTADSNLLEDVGQEIAPDALNAFYRDNNIYSYDLTDKANDDITWSTVSRYNSNIIVEQIGNAGWPQSNFAIVEFYFKSTSGYMITHFCKVADWTRQLIVDSYDGITKLPGYYGQPIAWATYKNNAAPIVVTPTYTIVETYSTPKQVQLTKQPTNLWGMNYHFDYMKDHPVEVHTAGEIVEITNKVRHEDGYYYYRRDGQVDGFNVADCVDYTPPPPPYILPAAPLPIVPAETYALSYPTPSYDTEPEALDPKRNKTNDVLAPGKYFIYAKNTDLNLVNLAVDNMHPGKWVNPADDVLVIPMPPAQPSNWIGPRTATPFVAAPAEIVPVAATTPHLIQNTDTFDMIIKSYKPFFPNIQDAAEYRIMRTITVSDQVRVGAPQKTLQAGKTVLIYGWFVKNKQKFLRALIPSDVGKQYYFYGIPTDNIQTGEPFLSNEFDTSMKIKYGIELLYDSAYKTIEGVFHKRKK